MSLIYKQYLECWLLERGSFVLTFFSLAACLVISFINDTSHAERLIQSPKGFLDGWRHIRLEIISSRLGSAVSYTSTITVRTGSNRPGCQSKNSHIGSRWGLFIKNIFASR